jgi:fluoride exporter
MNDWRTAIAISLGAIPGALSRYHLTVFCTRWFGTGFPYGTFLINITGAFMMGLFTTFILQKTNDLPELRFFVAVGFLGSYTTFSTYALDTSLMLRSQHYFLALFYWFGSALLGVIGLELGNLVARRFLI